MTREEKLELINEVLPDIRNLRQIFVAKNVGTIDAIDVLFLGEKEPEKILINAQSV